MSPRALFANKLPKEDLERVLKESYRTLISIKNSKKTQKQKRTLKTAFTDEDEDEAKMENLKKKYAKFTQMLAYGGATNNNNHLNTSSMSNPHHHNYEHTMSISSSACVSQMDNNLHKHGTTTELNT